MPVLTNQKDSKLRLKFKIGVDGEGNDILKTKTYSKVKSSATDEDVFTVVDTISNLQQHPLADLVRVDEKEIVGA